MKTIKIMCDECERDLTEVTGGVEYRLIFDWRKTDNKGFDIGGIKYFWEHSPFESRETEYHFCSKSCLKKYIE